MENNNNLHSHGLPKARNKSFAGQTFLPPKGPNGNNTSVVVVVSQAQLPSDLQCCSIPKPNQNDGGSEAHILLHSSSCSSSAEEQPPWLEELLNEPETPVAAKRGHSRSSSDPPFTYLEANEEEEEEELLAPSWGGFPRSSSCFKDLVGGQANSSQQDTNVVAANKVHSQAQSASSDHDAEAGGSSSGSLTNYPSAAPASTSKTESKRAKQHNGRRSRVRKLQYIADLERNVQALQAQGSQVSAEMQFLDQQNLILSMENRALKQRLESLSQVQLIKSMEQELLERELARLQYYLYHHHQHNVHLHRQQHQPQRHHPMHRRVRSCDLDSQFASLSLSLNPNESGSSRRDSFTFLHHR
ncbi:hypothetical protein Dimus_006748 [Dionaea muscipula]